jgi:hypothetical protein
MPKRNGAQPNSGADLPSKNSITGAARAEPLAVEPIRIEPPVSPPIGLAPQPDIPVVESPPLQPEAERKTVPEIPSVIDACARDILVGAPAVQTSTGAPSAAAAGVRRRIEAMRSRVQNLAPLAPVALAILFGALGGSLATLAISGVNSARAGVGEDARLARDVSQLSADLAALKATLEGAGHVTAAQLAKITQRLDRAERAQAEPAARLAKLSEAVERLDRRTAALAGDVTGALGDPRPSAPNEAKREARPPIVQGWVLRDVFDGSALVQGRIGLVEVEPGDQLPGLGRVETIRRQDGRWAVVTSRGLIVGANKP